MLIKMTFGALYSRNTVRSANKAEKSFFATLVPKHITCAAWTQNLMRLQRANGPVLIARSMVLKTRMLMKKMNTWSSAVFARKVGSCFAVTPARALTISNVVNRRLMMFPMPTGPVLVVPLNHFPARLKRF